MTESRSEAFILRDEAGEVYAIPPQALAAFRVPTEHRATVEKLAAEAMGADTSGFAQGQGHGQGHGSGNPHTLQPLLLTALPLPFLAIRDGTSNTLLFGER